MKLHPRDEGPPRIVLEKHDFWRLVQGKAVKCGGMEIILADIGSGTMLNAVNSLLPKPERRVVVQQECTVAGCETLVEKRPNVLPMCHVHLDQWSQATYDAKERGEAIPSLQEWLDGLPSQQEVLDGAG